MTIGTWTGWQTVPLGKAEVREDAIARAEELVKKGLKWPLRVTLCKGKSKMTIAGWKQDGTRAV